MIINENNKNFVLKGTVKRGFNQDPAELRAKLHPNAGKINLSNQGVEPTKQINQGSSTNNLKETFSQLRRLK